MWPAPTKIPRRHDEGGVGPVRENRDVAAFRAGDAHSLRRAAARLREWRKVAALISEELIPVMFANRLPDALRQPILPECPFLTERFLVVILGLTQKQMVLLHFHIAFRYTEHS